MVFLCSSVPYVGYNYIGNYRPWYVYAPLHHMRRDNPRGFWKRLRFDAHPLPLSLHPVQLWEDYLHKVANHPYSHVVDLPLDFHPLRHQHQALDLEGPISEEEVLAGVYHLKNGRPPGFHGYPSELFPAAQPDRVSGEPPEPHLLAPLLTEVLGVAFDKSIIPSEFNQSVVTPVFKRGDAGDPANYRPIALGILLSGCMRKSLAVCWFLSQRVVGFVHLRRLGFGQDYPLFTTFSHSSIWLTRRPLAALCTVVSWS
jgi:hypothetical protein